MEAALAAFGRTPRETVPPHLRECHLALGGGAGEAIGAVQAGGLCAAGGVSSSAEFCWSGIFALTCAGLGFLARCLCQWWVQEVIGSLILRKAVAENFRMSVGGNEAQVDAEQ